MRWPQWSICSRYSAGPGACCSHSWSCLLTFLWCPCRWLDHAHSRKLANNTLVLSKKSHSPSFLTSPCSCTLRVFSGCLLSVWAGWSALDYLCPHRGVLSKIACCWLLCLVTFHLQFLQFAAHPLLWLTGLSVLQLSALGGLLLVAYSYLLQHIVYCLLASLLKYNTNSQNCIGIGHIFKI